MVYQRFDQTKPLPQHLLLHRSIITIYCTKDMKLFVRALESDTTSTQ
jgi:hypothetical protein